MVKGVFIFGLGYVGQHFAKALVDKNIKVGGTSRDPQKQDLLKKQGLVDVLPYPFHPNDLALLKNYDCFVISTPSYGLGDTVFNFYRGYFERRQEPIRWLCYLSSTTVYGDYQGAWVDETSELLGKNQRDLNRILAEKQWLSLFDEVNLQYKPAPIIHLLRLAGIYGPGRSVIDRLSTNGSPPVKKDGLVFSRIHVDDIVQVLFKSLDLAFKNKSDNVVKDIFNVADDDPKAPEEVDAVARTLMGLQPVDPIDFKDAKFESRMLDFYNASKRVRNDKVKSILGVDLIYPSIKDGLEALLKNH